MSKVEILDDVVVNQIAAGEVVERPASVVKELVENSIDAQSSEIKVSITNGGKTSIEVIDNGIGMSRQDALCAIQRFGTSKIRTSSDLESISTLGFRGEAIPSIASVSKFSLHTSVADDDSGTFINIEGGKQIAVESVSAPKGTRIQIKSLFYNVPARKKFLRTDATESAQVRALINDFALAYPQIRFSLFVDTTPSLNYPETASFRMRVQQVKLAGSNPVEISETLKIEDEQIRIRGMLCSPIDSVSSANKLRLLVNGRSVRDKLLIKAVRDGYSTFLRPGRHPSGVLSIELPAQEVDVNVHPQKTEVRFRNPSQVFRAVLLSVSRGLSSVEVPQSDQESAAAIERTEVNPSNASFSYSRAASGAQTGASDYSQTLSTIAGEVNQVQANFQDRSTGMPDISSLSSMRFVGQIFSLYLLFEGMCKGVESFAVLDMHAAHERVVFYQLKQQYQQKKIESQQLLIPIEIELSPQETERLSSGDEILRNLGFSYAVSNDQIKVSAIPAILANADINRIIRDLVSEPKASWKVFVETQLDHVLSRIACHGSVRSGRELKDQEVVALLDSLVLADSSGLCPHGRPVVRYFSEYQLEQFFGRS